MRLFCALCWFWFAGKRELVLHRNWKPSATPVYVWRVYCYRFAKEQSVKTAPNRNCPSFFAVNYVAGRVAVAAPIRTVACRSAICAVSLSARQKLWWGIVLCWLVLLCHSSPRRTATRLLKSLWLVWRSSNGVRHFNEFKLRQAWLVLGLVADLWRVYHPGIFQATQAHSAWPSLRGQVQRVPEMVSAISEKKWRLWSYDLMVL